MRNKKSQARHTLLAALGIAASTLVGGIQLTATADESPLHGSALFQALALEGDESPLAVAQVNHNAPYPFAADDAEADDEAEEVEGEEGDSVPLTDYKKLLDRVDELESAWGEHKEELADEAAAKKKKSSWKMGGRIHLDNWNFVNTDAGTNTLETGDPTDDPEDRWDFRRIRLEFSGKVPNNMLFRTQIDFNNPAVAEMKDVYFGFEGLPNNQQLWIGNQKRPIGLDHLNSSRHNMFLERPLAVETFNEDARRLGVCMHGHNDDLTFAWHYGAFLLENLNTDGRYRGDFNEGGLYGRLVATPWYDEVSGGRGYFHAAVVGSVNPTDGDGTLDHDDNANEGRFRTRPLGRSDNRWWNTNRIQGAENYQQIGCEMMLNIGAFQVTSEYFGTFVQRDALGGFNGEDLTFHGGYIFANYFWTGEHIPLNRVAGTIDRVKPFENFFVVDRCCGGTGKGMGALSTGVRFDYLDLSDSDIRGGQGYAVTAGMNWYWTAYSKLQTNMIWGEIENAGQATPGAGNVPLAAGVDGDFAILGMRYMLDF
ncbi:MAG: OprO/OprP family phosphate-selective porin [Rubripirellula sp.]